MKIATNINLERFTKGLLALAFTLVGLLFVQHLVKANPTLEPGEVRVSKTAKAVPGKINTWDIELSIEARNSRKTSDIVLVMDRSGSMSNNNRLVNAKIAANTFIDTLLPVGNTTNRIALVSFAGKKSNGSKDVTIESNLVGASGSTTLKSRVDSLAANGGTFTQAAIRDAEPLLNGSTADHKSIVLLSDGEPTYSYRPNNADSNLTSQAIGGYSASNCGVYNTTSGNATKTGLTYNYNQIVGCGNQMFHQYSRGSFYNFGNAAIDQANMIKANHPDYTIYTIALNAGARGEPVLKGIATTSGDAYTADPEDLQAIFEEIAGKLSAGATDINITDVVAPEFKITNNGGGAVSGNTVDWTNVQLGAADANGVRKATKTIRIELADAFAGTDNQYQTNSSVDFNYKDVDGEVQNKKVASPIVNPVLIHTEKVVNGYKAQASDSFDIAVTDVVGANFGHVFTDSGSQTSNKGREAGNYNVTETITGGQYDITYEHKIGDNPYQPGTAINLAGDYQATTDGINSNNDIYVRVTNKAKLGSLTIEKKLGDCNLNTPANPTSGTAFVFEVKNASGEVVRTVTLHVTKGGCFSSETIADLPQGTYTVTEKNAEGYTTTFVVSGNSSVQNGKVANVTVGLASDLAQAVTFSNVFTKERTITVNKAWEGGKSSDWIATFELWRDGAKLAGQDKTITGNGSASWTVPEADIYGIPYDYAIKEITPANYTPTSNCTTEPCAVDTNGNLSITNTYKSPKTELTAEKVWVGGPATHPTIQFQLYRDNVALGDPINLPNGTTEYTWVNLDATDENGNAYTYTVKEVAVPANYDMTQDGNTITNKYTSPTGPITAKKIWDGGDANNRPDVEFQLFRHTGNEAEAEAVGEIKTLTTAHGATEVTVTWADLELTNGNGVTYTFFVKELTNLANYTPTHDGLTVTNTYQIPTRDIAVKKVWNDGTSLIQPVDVELKRDGVVVDTVTLSDDNGWTYTWENLNVTDFNARPHLYTVDEINVPDNFEPITIDDEDGTITITNEYNIPTDGEATATKIWVNGPTPRPDVQFQLYRQIGDGAAEAVPGAEIKTLPDGITSVTWTSLAKTDINGVAYTFSVREVSTPENYTKDEQGLTVTNTYVIPTNGQFTAYKKWDGGPSPRPTIWFQLLRSTTGKDGSYQIVPDASVQELADGTGEVSWVGLEKSNINGNPYLFKVQETNAEGVELTPTNYESTISEDGSTIINTYVSPKITYTVEKIWRDNFPIHQNIQVQLYRNGEPYGNPITLASGVTKYTWVDLEKTDRDGVEYVYTVDEVKVPIGYVKYVDGNRIVNTFTDTFTPGKGGGTAERPERAMPSRLAETGDNVAALLLASVILIIIGLALIPRQTQTDPVDI